MGIYLSITLLILNIVNVILHGTGTYLLLSLYESCRHKVQQIFLITLSICEGTINLIEAFKSVTTFITLSEKDSNIMTEVTNHVLILQFCGISFVYYVDMIYITVDRLMEIFLNIRYPVFWDETKTKILTGITWFIGLITFIVVSLLKHYNNFDWEDAFFKFFYPVLEFAFLIIAFFTYGFIFHKYKQTRIIPAVTVNNNKIQKRRRSTVDIFRKSRFYVPLLLILTFAVFMIGADLTYLFVVTLGDVSEETATFVYNGCFISYTISNLADAYIYIFMNPEVKRLLFKKLHIASLSGSPENTFAMETSKSPNPSVNYNLRTMNEIPSSRSLQISSDRDLVATKNESNI